MRSPEICASRGGSLGGFLVPGSPLGRRSRSPTSAERRVCAFSARLGGFAAASADLVPAPAVVSALKRKARKTSILYNYHFFRLAGRVRLLPPRLRGTT